MLPQKYLESLRILNWYVSINLTSIHNRNKYINKWRWKENVICPTWLMAKDAVFIQTNI